MNLEPLRRLQSKLSVAFVAATALVLTACGGGGATSSPNNVGNLQLLPASASIYAGVPYKANIVGGRKPYLVTSSEQTLIELNFTTDSNEFTFVARNPGVVDVGLDPNEVPRRSVNIEIRDSNGATISNTYSVLQNFFTGYRESYSNTCPVATGDTAPQACAGIDSIVTLVPVSNGLLYSGREFQFDKVRGDFSFVVEDPAAVPQLVNQIRVRTDTNGKAIVRLRPTATARTQLATYKVTDIATGVTTDVVFLIVGAQAQPLTLIPTSVTFTGGLTTQCGGGSADIFIFGGTPPYTVAASNGISVSAVTPTIFGGRFTINVSGGGGGFSPIGTAVCPTGLSVVVADSAGATAVLPVSSEPGTTTLPALTAVPSSIAVLGCGQSVGVTVVGGTGSFTASSQHARVTAAISGNTLTLTRLTGDGATIYPVTGTASVTDGSTAISVTFSGMPNNCP
ncbi:MAG TPA: hypothetical protein VFV55_00555 [Usitatibacteraceae bacterium]|nr:hypothetical protein [Usitatibacteraceae bacterium]